MTIQRPFAFALMGLLAVSVVAPVCAQNNTPKPSKQEKKAMSKPERKERKAERKMEKKEAKMEARESNDEQQHGPRAGKQHRCGSGQH